MNVVLAFPPQWTPLSPHCSLTALSAQLKNNNHDVKVFDLNIDFYNYVLQPDYVQQQLNKIFEQKALLKDRIGREYQENLDPNLYSNEFKLAAKKFTKIKELEKEGQEYIQNVIGQLPTAIEVLKSKEYFYSVEALESAYLAIDTALEIVSLPFYPYELSLHDLSNAILSLTYDKIKKEALSPNIFKEFYGSKLDEILKLKPELIAISIGSSSQLIGGLALAAMLKRYSDSQICIGGNYISRITDAIMDTPDFFETFADYVVYEEGELALTELTEYLDCKIPIEQVSSLIYKDEDDDSVIKNDRKPPVKLNEMHTQNLDDYNLSDYFLPEIVLPMQASRGCYWKKCTFCDHDFGQTYNVKDISKLVNEIKELQNKYGISHFEFVDEAINANYLKNLSQRIIDEGLKINWYCNARLENDLTFDILKKAREAGLRMILWGYESGSAKIMKVINKGVDVEKRLEILKRANDADIWNFAYIFFGCPTETIDDAMETVDAICNNTDIIPAYGKSKFSLGKHAIIKANPEQYGVKILSEREQPFSTSCSFELSSGMQNQELEKLMEFFSVKSIKAYGNAAWMTVRYRESLFLYICKYGMASVKSLKPTLLLED